MTPSTSTFSLARGSELDRGKYRIRRLIGRGGMGAVFVAEHCRTGKVVALKCIDIARNADPECVERLAREALAACRVRHPNVVDVYDVGRDGDIMFLVMEYLDGEPFSNVLERRDLPCHRLIALLLPALRGVAEAHRQGVVHRDIKPDNILLARQVDSSTPVAKVLDFGIAKLQTSGHQLRALTGEGLAVGTPRYMSFEQLLGEDDLDGRTDVYAFGVILYEALTGRVPYDADTSAQLLGLLTAGAPPSPEKCGAEVPVALSRLVMSALAREREQRVGSMDELIRGLEPFATLRPYGAGLTGYHAAATEPLWPAAGPRPSASAAEAKPSNPPIPTAANGQPRRAPMLLMAALAVLTLACLGVALHSLRSSPQPAPHARKAVTVTNVVRLAPPERPQQPARADEALPHSTRAAEPERAEPRVLAPIQLAPERPAVARPRPKPSDRPRDYGIY